MIRLIHNFIPANLKFGTGFDFILDDYNKVGLNVEFSKLLVPTPQVGYNGSNYTGTDVNNDGVIDKLILTSPHKNINQLVGFLEYSNRDAPEGIKEEIKEVTYAVGQNIRIKIHSHCV
jgi:hypothetical protein